MMKHLAALALLLLAAPALAGALDAPDDNLTPGKVRADIGIEQAMATKWGKDRRHVTPAMIREVARRYGITLSSDDRLGVHDKSCGKPRCEIDHRVPRECLGADDVDNLSYQTGRSYRFKDRLENYEARRFLNGEITLEDCQAVFLGDWQAEYRRVYGPLTWD